MNQRRTTPHNATFILIYFFLLKIHWLSGMCLSAIQLQRQDQIRAHEKYVTNQHFNILIIYFRLNNCNYLVIDDDYDISFSTSSNRYVLINCYIISQLSIGAFSIWNAVINQASSSHRVSTISASKKPKISYRKWSERWLYILSGNKLVPSLGFRPLFTSTLWASSPTIFMRFVQSDTICFVFVAGQSIGNYVT